MFFIDIIKLEYFFKFLVEVFIKKSIKDGVDYVVDIG